MAKNISAFLIAAFIILRLATIQVANAQEGTLSKHNLIVKNHTGKTNNDDFDEDDGPDKRSDTVKAAKPAKPQSQAGIVVADQAMVYTEPHFDAEVIDYLRAGTKIRISTKQYPPYFFYRVRLSKGRYGYMSDVDIKSIKDFEAAQKQDSSDSANDDWTAGSDNKRRLPFVATRYVGLNISPVNFTENTLGDTYSEVVTMIGMKFFGPSVVMDGPILGDINVLAFFDAPGYYETKTRQGATGLLLITDALVVHPFEHNNNRLTYFGFGPMLLFSKFEITAGTKTFSLQEIKLGAAFNLGVAVRLGRYALHLEGKYYWEREKYFALGATLQVPWQ